MTEIINEFMVCPYCMEDKYETYTLCCGEIHSELAYELSDGIVILASEMSKNLTSSKSSTTI